MNLDAQPEPRIGGVMTRHSGNHDITDLLNTWSRGDSTSADKLFDLVYPQLRQVARRHLNLEPNPPSIQATELIHETYLRLLDQRQCRWQNRAHFFAIAATLIRRILVDHAKYRRRHRRGGGVAHLPLSDVTLSVNGFNLNLLSLDQALVELAGIRMTAARIIELRYFAGLDLDEAAQVLGLSQSTAKRKWRFARAWLAQRLGVSQ